MEKVRAGGDKSTVSPVSAEKPTTKTGPSLEKLLGVWKASETEARRKKEAELEAAHKVHNQIVTYSHIVSLYVPFLCHPDAGSTRYGIPIASMILAIA